MVSLVAGRTEAALRSWTACLLLAGTWRKSPVVLALQSRFRFGLADLLAQRVPSYHEKSNLQVPRLQDVAGPAGAAFKPFSSGWVQDRWLGLAVHACHRVLRMPLPGKGRLCLCGLRCCGPPGPPNRRWPSSAASTSTASTPAIPGPCCSALDTPPPFPPSAQVICASGLPQRGKL